MSIPTSSIKQNSSDNPANTNNKIRAFRSDISFRTDKIREENIGAQNNFACCDRQTQKFTNLQTQLAKVSINNIQKIAIIHTTKLKKCKLYEGFPA